MNLSFLIDPDAAEGHPWKLFAAGAVYAIVGVVLGLMLFRDHASFMMVTILVLATLPIVHKVITREEEKDESAASERQLLREHEHAIKAFCFLFLGFVCGFLAAFVFMPPADANALFRVQMDTIMSIHKATGAFLESLPVVSTIIINNLRVLLFTVLFSLLFGSGALFILAWNGSVMAAAIGSFIRTKLALAGDVAFSFTAVSGGFLRYLIHGIPEIAAYFVGCLAGGILYNALLKRSLSGKIVNDVMILLGISVGIIVVSAFIEVFLTPLIASGV